MIQTAQRAVKFIVAHHFIEADNFSKRLIYRVRCLFRRFAIGNDLEDGAHDVLFLMNKRLMSSLRLGSLS